MNAEQTEYRETAHIKMPIWSFAVGVVLTSLVFVAFAWQGWRLQRQFEDVSQFSIEATRAASGLQYLDSAMTVSAFMATHSKGTDWRKRHARHAKELDLMLSRARDSAPDRSTISLLNDLSIARVLIAEMEQEAFDLTEAGDSETAQDTLTNPIYASNQALYSHNRTLFVQRVHDFVTERTLDLGAIIRNVFWAMTAGFGLIFVAWFEVYRSQRKFASENGALHADQEARVAQRTQSLNEQIEQTQSAQSALQAREAQLRAALDNMSDGLFMLDADLNYVTFNHRYIELVGIPEDRFEVGQPIHDVLDYAARHGFYGPGDPEEQVRAHDIL